MSQKQNIVDMLEDGKGYDEIEDKTGSKRSYIRSIAVAYRKRDAENEGDQQENEPTHPPKTESEEAGTEPSMNFVDDANPHDRETGSKTGLNHHKAWVKAAKYECGGCGATIGRTTDFCPHCGQRLHWEGIE